MSLSDDVFIRRCLTVFALIAAAWVLFQMANLFLLIFAAVVFATILSAVRALVTRISGLGGGWAMLVSVLAVFGLLAAIFSLFGTQISREFETIRVRLPEALGAAQQQLDQWGIGTQVRGLVEQGAGDVSGLLSRAGGYALTAGSGLADFVLILVGGIFLAVQPGLYRRGLLALVPKKGEALAAKALDDSGRALSLWLKGQIVSMVAVAVLTGVGLWLLGVPAAFGLALIAGLLDFIPFVGPIIAAVPAVILAFVQGPATALWTIGLFLLVQQIQGNFLQPMVQKHAVDVPPAVLLFAVAAAGVLFGFLGVILAAPLTVVVYVLVQRLYVQAALGKDIKVAVEEA